MVDENAKSPPVSIEDQSASRRLEVPKDPQISKKLPHHKLSQVIYAVFSFYMMVVLFDSKGIYSWTTKISINQITQKLRILTESHWRKMAALGFEEPKYTIETVWLDLQEAHPLLYPRKYEVQKIATEVRKSKKREREIAWAKNPKLKREFEQSREIATTSNVQADFDGRRILIVGDSLMMTIGPILREEFEQNPKVQVALKAKLATGLARPDVFDWKGEINQMTNQNRYDAVILMMGTNDSQDFAVNGEILSYGTAAWVKAYKSRIAGVMDLICKNSGQGIWIGLPPMQSNNFQRKAARLNQWIERTAERHTCIQYLDTARLLGNSEGKYLSYLTVDGKSEKIRMADGIHISKKGALLLMGPVFEALQLGAGHKSVMSH